MTGTSPSSPGVGGRYHWLARCPGANGSRGLSFDLVAPISSSQSQVVQGRSHGCPGVPPVVTQQVLDHVVDGEACEVDLFVFPLVCDAAGAPVGDISAGEVACRKAANMLPHWLVLRSMLKASSSRR